MIPEDIKTLAVPVLAHRLTTARTFGLKTSGKEIIERLLTTVPLPTEDWGKTAMKLLVILILVLLLILFQGVFWNKFWARELTVDLHFADYGVTEGEDSSLLKPLPTANGCRSRFSM